jgi:hypothetical protein
MENNKKRPKANSKLQNIKAIRQMLDGTHHTQTKKSISTYVGKRDTQKREVGERWTDANGVVWEQREGFRIQGVDRAERMAEIRKYLQGATKCPECDAEMNGRNDKKYYNIHKMCMECSVKLETRMRAEGTWKEYERKKVLGNVTSWLRDAEVEKDILLEQVGKDSYVNGDGKLEKWELPYDVAEQQARIEKGFQEFKKNLLTKYGATEEELEQFGVSETGEKDG